MRRGAAEVTEPIPGTWQHSYREAEVRKAVSDADVLLAYAEQEQLPLNTVLPTSTRKEAV